MPSFDPRQQYGSATRGRSTQDTEAMFGGANRFIGGAKERVREVDFDPTAPVMQTGSPTAPSVSGIAEGISNVVPMSDDASGMLRSGAKAADVILGMYQFGKAASGAKGVLDGLRTGATAPQAPNATLSGSQPLYKAASGIQKAVSLGDKMSSYADGGGYDPASSIRPDQQEQWQRQRSAADMRAIPRGIAGTAAAMFGYGPR